MERFNRFANEMRFWSTAVMKKAFLFAIKRNSLSTIDDGRLEGVSDNVVFQICSRDEAVALTREQTRPK